MVFETATDYRGRGAEISGRKMMTEEQKVTIEKIVELAKHDDKILGVLLCGSIANQTATAKSDVDVMVILDDESFSQISASKEYFWGTDFDNTSFAVEIDGKIISKKVLREAWKKGSDAIKNTLKTAKVIFDRNDDIKKLLVNHDMAEGERLEKIRKFYAMMKSSRYSYEANSDSTFLKHSLIHDTIFYAFRLILAYNYRLFPCVKNAEKEIKRCRSVPIGLLESANKLLSTYAENDLDDFYGLVDAYISEFHFDNKQRRGLVLENEFFWFFNMKPYAFL